MKKDTVKRELHQHEGYPALLDHLAELLPDDAEFTILQFNPDGTLRVLHPIERPGYTADELRRQIDKREVSRKAFERLVEFLSESILIEISGDGEINKISVPGGGSG